MKVITIILLLILLACEIYEYCYVRKIVKHLRNLDDKINDIDLEILKLQKKKEVTKSNKKSK